MFPFMPYKVAVPQAVENGLGCVPNDGSNANAFDCAVTVLTAEARAGANEMLSPATVPTAKYSHFSLFAQLSHLPMLIRDTITWDNFPQSERKVS